jgi:hypothetical protein
MTAMNKKEWSIVCTVQTWAVVIRKLDKTNKSTPFDKPCDMPTWKSKCSTFGQRYFLFRKYSARNVQVIEHQENLKSVVFSLLMSLLR